MSYQEEDQEIKQLFDRLREEDEVRTPSFDAILRRPRVAAWERTFAFLQLHRMAVAALVLVAIAVPVLLQVSSPTVPDENLDLTFYDWESPTDFLLTAQTQSASSSDTPTLELELPSWVSSDEIHSFD